jgi:hypothetical protein
VNVNSCQRIGGQRTENRAHRHFLFPGLYSLLPDPRSPFSAFRTGMLPGKKCAAPPSWSRRFRLQVRSICRTERPDRNSRCRIERGLNASHRLAQVNVVEQVQGLDVEVQRVLLRVRIRPAAAQATRSAATAAAKGSSAKSAAETSTTATSAATTASGRRAAGRLNFGSDPEGPADAQIHRD